MTADSAPVTRRATDPADSIAMIERGFAAGRSARLADLEVQAQDSAQRAADALARGNHDYGVMLLVCALLATEEIDRLQPTTHPHSHLKGTS